jgi:hypothetical protein
MATFEQISGIPPNHSLKQVDFYCRSGDDHWQQHEYEAGGQLVARYES